MVCIFVRVLQKNKFKNLSINCLFIKNNFNNFTRFVFVHLFSKEKTAKNDYVH